MNLKVMSVMDSGYDMVLWQEVGLLDEKNTGSIELFLLLCYLLIQATGRQWTVRVGSLFSLLNVPVVSVQYVLGRHSKGQLTKQTHGYTYKTTKTHTVDKRRKTQIQTKIIYPSSCFNMQGCH